MTYKNGVLYFLFFFLYLMQSCTDPIKSSEGSELNVILDTDIGGDIDDLGALYALHVYADQGLCDIIGIMSSWSMVHHVEGIDAVNTYFNRGDLPVGAHEDYFFSKEEYTWHLGQKYPRDLDGKSAEKTTPLYRKLLANQSDSSVTIIVTGRLNNIYNLLKSESDSISDLDGKDLINKKVKEFYIMGGRYDGLDKKEANFHWGGIGVSKYVIENIDRPMIFNGGNIGHIENGYSFGTALNKLNEDNIMKSGYQYFFQNPPDWTGRISEDSISEWSIWDIITVQAAVTGVDKYFGIQTHGTNRLDSLGKNYWDLKEDRNHSFLTIKMDPAKYSSEVIKPLLVTEPKKK